ncbi:MAG: tyrosine-type recombinase/integrase [Burkholderiaceae bacterium]
MDAKLTKSFVDKLPYANVGQVFYRDAELKGFGLRVGATAKTYIAESKVNGRVARVTIGKHGVFTAEQARAEARGLLQQMAKGINPNDVKAERRAKAITLRQTFEDFLAARKALKPRTVYDYRRFMGLLSRPAAGEQERRNPRRQPGYFEDWLEKPIAEITKDMVARRHGKIGETSPAQANLAMRFLRALFNFAIGRYEDSKGQPLIGANPVTRLSQTKAWYRVERRQSIIKSHELSAWFQAVLRLDSMAPNGKAETVRDYLIILLLTGLRRQEAARLTWDRVDLAARTIAITDTKNRQDHVLPVSDYLFQMLQERKQSSSSNYVFPGDGRTGHLIEPRKQMAKVTSQSGIRFTPHDLRRTFITVAESLDVPAYALKRLLNHKMPNDVTAGYIVIDVERLRKPMQQITDYILSAAGIRPNAEVVSFPTAHAALQRTAE